VFLTYSVFLLAFTLAAAASAAAGVWLNAARDVARRLVPASGLLLMAVALLLLFPELAHLLGWAGAALFFLAALAIVWAVDKFIYPVCPVCSASHDHEDCPARLHGFAAPLLIAMLIHNGFDGWMLSFGQGEADPARALSLSVIAHKIPECFAFGAILEAALKSRRAAFAWAVLTQAGTLVGAGLHRTTAAWLSPIWIGALLALGGAVFLYLGFHAVHSEWKRRAAAHLVRIGLR
jgi:zinc transporter ZupT